MTPQMFEKVFGMKIADRHDPHVEAICFVSDSDLKACRSPKCPAVAIES